MSIVRRTRGKNGINESKLYDEMSHSEIQKKASNIRNFMAGYVGGKKIADKLSDDDVVKIADLKDELAKIKNLYTNPVNAEIDYILKKYRIKNPWK